MVFSCFRRCQRTARGRVKRGRVVRFIVKLSGKALHSNQALATLFAELKSQDIEAVLVHGGGVEVDQILSALEFTTTKKDGIRVSPREQMPYIAGTLAGQCNKLLQGEAIKNGLKAVGMLCTDYDMCKLTAYPQEYGMVASAGVGDITMVSQLLAQGYTPVVSSIGLDEKGDLYNINADEVATALAIAFKAPLVFLSDVPGVLDANGEVIDMINKAVSDELIASGVITEGMAVKVKNALKVAADSTQPVFIASIFDQGALQNLSKLRRIGTTLLA